MSLYINGDRSLPEFTSDDLEGVLSGDPDELDVHLVAIDQDIEIDGLAIKIHCHCLTVDGNSRIRVERLIEFMRHAIVDYAIPKSKLKEAQERDAKYNSGSAVAALHHQAMGTFTDLNNTGEGGEMLLFLLAERFLKLPQVLSKMDLKTDSRVHYHGADGVYAGVDDDGLLKLYWGESKVYGGASDAIRDCLASLALFLTETDHEGSSRERDLVLLSDKADLNDPALTAAFKKYFDKTTALSNRVQYCGVALVGFDAGFYPANDTKAVAEEISNAAKAEIENWVKQIRNRISVEKLERFHIEFFCVPIPSADGFRSALLKALGHR
ncbi:HamA C-terminal domain-containing protein [Sphingorhabdus sp. M41]|uniref:HamA C-terminal domain-containing protein n=1 Tax=Sphingorhabdus sp. M41 TaxID=1806885 RepID=UPI00078CB19F|nr:DUF1837 domain-containing protein [Sphingorhabdus sp. M41]AMO72506.1 hypothetical protein AZE99_12170 [Sphingorhabdus sp. M41]